MKKKVTASALAIIMLMSGCEGGSILGGSPPDLNKPYELTAEIKQDDFEAEADVTRSAEDNWEFVFVAPEEISGLVVRIADGVYSAEFDGLTLETDDDSAIYSTIPSLIAETLDAAAVQDGTTVTDKNGMQIISGNVGQYAYTIAYDKADGEITKLEVPSQQLTVDFTEPVSEEAAPDVTSQ